MCAVMWELRTRLHGGRAFWELPCKDQWVVASSAGVSEMISAIWSMQVSVKTSYCQLLLCLPVLGVLLAPEANLPFY